MINRRSRKNPFDRYKKPRKQALIGNTAGAERKPLTPAEYKKWLESLPLKSQAGKKPLTLPEKANELSRLAIQKGDSLKHGPDYFVNFFQYRRVLKEQLERYDYGPAERRKAFISAVGSKDEIIRTLHGINQWTKEMGRPDLELTFDEMIDLILE